VSEKVTPRIGAGKPGPGRPKGVPNKLNGQLKEMILAALSEAGGVQYLVDKAESHPQAFISLLGRVLPLQIAGDPDNPVKTSLEVTFK
jgi:hypothetical protein